MPVVLVPYLEVTLEWAHSRCVSVSEAQSSILSISLCSYLSPQLTLSLSFMEAVRGCTKQVSLRVQATCERCLGSGGEPGTREQTCPYCQGRGEVSGERRGEGWFYGRWGEES